MEIYTSYFGNLKRLNSDGIIPIGIAVYPPKWYKGQNYKRLAPASQMLRMTIDEYDRMFQKILAYQSPRQVYDDLRRMSRGKPIALLCFELDRRECHRLQVAEWIEGQMGIKVPEYPHPVPRNSFIQTSMF